MNNIMILSMIGILFLSGIGAGAAITMNAPTDNHAPIAPTIDGPTQVKVGVVNTWSFNSTDPDGDNITYYVDWGDACGGAEWHGPFPSGEKIELTHIYTEKNILIINSLAVDENGAESNMTYFEVNITKKSSSSFIFMHLLERFQNAFYILRVILDSGNGNPLSYSYTGLYISSPVLFT